MTTLLERWADRGASVHSLLAHGYDELVENVRILYASDPTWQEDGSPEEVAAQLWTDLQEAM